MLMAILPACDLRLDKPLPSAEHMVKPMVDDAYEQQCNGVKNWFVAEEQRAVLACYALSSMYVFPILSIIISFGIFRTVEHSSRYRMILPTQHSCSSRLFK